MSGTLRKYEEAIKFHQTVFNDLMANYPESEQAWRHDLETELRAVCMVATYDDDISPEQVDVLHSRKEDLIYGHNL